MFSRGSIVASVVAVVVSGCFGDPPEGTSGADDTGGTTDSTGPTSGSTTMLDTTTGNGTTTVLDETDTTESETDTDGEPQTPGELLWHLELPSPARVAPTVDDALIIVGSHAQTVEILGEEIPFDGGGSDIYVVRVEPPDTLAWRLAIRSDLAEFAHAVATSPSGRFAVSGTWDGGPLTVGDGAMQHVVPQAGRNAFFVLFESDGTVARADFVQSVVDYFGGAYLTSDARIVGVSGFSGNAVAPDGGVHSSAGDRDAFFLTLDMNGQQAAFTRWGGVQVDHAAAVAPDGLQPGHSYVVGAFSGTVQFGGHALTSGGGTDVFVLHLDFLGQVDWAVAAGGPGDDAATAVAVDGMGRPYVVGNFRDTFETPSGFVLQSAGNTDIFLMALDQAGTHRWSRGFGGQGEDLGRGAAATAQGAIFLAGEFAAQADFGGDDHPLSEGGKDAVVASYDADGELRWITTYGSPGDDRANMVTVGSTGVFATLGISGEIELGPGETVGAAGQHTGVVLQYAP